jgi:hypothetical protein
LVTYFTLYVEFYLENGGLTGFDSLMAILRSFHPSNAESALCLELDPGTQEVFRSLTSAC